MIKPGDRAETKGGLICRVLEWDGPWHVKVEWEDIPSYSSMKAFDLTLVSE